MTPADRARACAPHLEALMKAADVQSPLDLFGLYAGLLGRCLETMTMVQLQEALALCAEGGMRTIGAAVSHEMGKRLAQKRYT